MAEQTSAAEGPRNIWPTTGRSQHRCSAISHFKACGALGYDTDGSQCDSGQQRRSVIADSIRRSVTADSIQHSVTAYGAV